MVASVTALALVLASAAGCAYRSEYVAPQDGRARVVWGSNDHPAAELAGTSPSPVCSSELKQLTNHHEVLLASGQRLSLDAPIQPIAYRVVSSGYWEPRYYGPNLNIIVVRPGLVPHLPHPPLFLPTLARPIVSAPVYTPPRISGGGGGGGGMKLGSGGGGGGDGKGLGIAVLVAIVVAVTTLPAIALGFASSFPEPTYKSSTAIDVVNAYNDLLRSSGSPCDPMAAAPPVGGVL